MSTRLNFKKSVRAFPPLCSCNRWRTIPGLLYRIRTNASKSQSLEATSCQRDFRPDSLGPAPWFAPRSSDLLSLSLELCFHRCFGRQAVEIPRNGCDGENPAGFLVGYCAIPRIQAAIDLDFVPAFSVPDVTDGNIVVLTPKKMGPHRTLPNGPGDSWLLPALAAPRRPNARRVCARQCVDRASGRGENSRHAGFEVLVDGDAAFNGKPGSLR